jgi:hypothetical protein
VARRRLAVHRHPYTGHYRATWWTNKLIF